MNERKKKKGKSCNSHRLRNTFQHKEDSVAFELSVYLYAEIYTNAFIRSVCVHTEL